MSAIARVLRASALPKQYPILSRACRGRASSGTDPQTQIQDMINKQTVVVFMKGVPDEPKCGFSNAVVQILRMHGVKYEAFDVLKNEQLRQEIKDFSNWPTIPQIFINGEFVGGCDILLQMHQSGDLIDELRKVGIRSALLEAAVQDTKGSFKDPSEK